MKFNFVVTTMLFLGAMSPSFADIQGFEDPALLEKVMAGKIVLTKQIDTETESKMIAKSFFNKVSADQYLDLTISYQKYPQIFEEVQAGKMKTANDVKTEFTYWLDYLVKIGFIKKHLYPEGKHVLERAKDQISESKVLHVVTNYQEDIDTAKQVVRVIPYQGGILVEDMAHVKAAKHNAYAKAAKKEFQRFFSNYSSNLRQYLKGDY